MLDHLHCFILPAAYALLPPAMASRRATALLLAIALQESQCRYRRQRRGPARGFWQFEAGKSVRVTATVADVVVHSATKAHLQQALVRLCYPKGLAPTSIQIALEHNDVLAAVVARLNLWTLPAALPGPQEVDRAWQHYLATWRPGKPRPKTWATNYARAWSVTGPE